MSNWDTEKTSHAREEKKQTACLTQNLIKTLTAMHILLPIQAQNKLKKLLFLELNRKKKED